MKQKYTKEECRKQILHLAVKLGMSPNLISLRLLSDLDKNDMMYGLLPIEALEAHIKAWMDHGMPNYAKGETIPFEKELMKTLNKNIPQKVGAGLKYRPPFCKHVG